MRSLISTHPYSAVEILIRSLRKDETTSFQISLWPLITSFVVKIFMYGLLGLVRPFDIKTEPLKTTLPRSD
jgi:hypothetical protein